MQSSDRRRPRVRAFRFEEASDQVLRHVPGLALFCGGPAGLARALRQVRKAAWAGEAGYDPARHAALLHLARRARGGAGPVQGMDRPPPV